MSSITWAQGNTRTGLPVACQNGVGVGVTTVDLSTMTSIVVTMQRIESGYGNAPWTTLGGASTVINASQGLFTYKFIASDVAIPGVYNLVVTVHFSDSTDWVSLPAQFTIQETR